MSPAFKNSSTELCTDRTIAVSRWGAATQMDRIPFQMVPRKAVPRLGLGSGTWPTEVAVWAFGARAIEHLLAGSAAPGLEEEVFLDFIHV